MIIQVIINTDEESVEILIPKQWAKSAEVRETIDKELVKEVKQLLPKLAHKLKEIEDERR
jgi:hypothetical protein